MRNVRRLLRPFFSRRFLRFAAVGASGVVVNVGALALLRTVGRVQTNIAAALAIELSIVSNFLLNHGWTFRDRRAADRSVIGRLVRFHLVSSAGALVQFATFVACNVLWLAVRGGPAALRAYNGAERDFIHRWIIHPLAAPPRLGALVYLSQLAGVGVATVWNFLVNFHWTWAARESTPEV